LNKPAKIVRLLLALSRLPIGAAGFSLIIQKDHGSLPSYLAHASEYLRLIQSVRGTDAPKGLRGKAIGDWLLSRQIQLYQAAFNKVAFVAST
jgi:tRNA nucleotidyltransferase/poly(A) polymerase